MLASPYMFCYIYDLYEISFVIVELRGAFQVQLWEIDVVNVKRSQTSDESVVETEHRSPPPPEFGNIKLIFDCVTSELCGCPDKLNRNEGPKIILLFR